MGRRRLIAGILGVIMAVVMAFAVVPPKVAQAAGAYSAYLPTEEDDEATLAAKQVTFAGIKWYIIEDNSTEENEGTLTLLTAENIGTSEFSDRSSDTNTYYKSKVYYQLVRFLYESLMDYDSAIKKVDLPDVELKDEYVYLLSKSEASALPRTVRKSLSGKVSYDYWWWLRTPNDDSRNAMCVESGGGEVLSLSLVLEAGIRPALQVDLSALCFSAETNTFSLLKPVTDVILDCTVKQTITVGDTLRFKADVYPENATYKTVIWSVSNGNVRLYADKACTKEVGTKATTTMTVYAKGVNAGDATITVTSAYHSDKSSSCDITVKKKEAKKTGTWKRDKNGWWYKLSDGTWPKNCWKKIDGKWYYFKKTGYAAQSEFVKGWWLNASCVQSDPVKCSWHKDKNGWWYGGGKWYAKNAIYTIDGKAYTFDKNGYCVE